jgi:hypothetical protein
MSLSMNGRRRKDCMRQERPRRIRRHLGLSRVQYYSKEGFVFAHRTRTRTAQASGNLLTSTYHVHVPRVPQVAVAPRTSHAAMLGLRLDLRKYHHPLDHEM